MSLQNTLSNSASSVEFRAAFRGQQLAGVISKEITSALRSSSFLKRSFCLGPSALEVDLDLFGLDVPRLKSQQYAMKDGSLSSLDKLLGVCWDVLEMPDGMRYVTNMEVHIRKDFLLAGSVSVALCREPVPKENYRQFLAQHTVNSGVAHQSEEELSV